MTSYMLSQLRAYVEDYCPPVGTRTENPGHWVAESSWPSPHIHTKRLHLDAGGSLLEEAGPEAEVAICSPCSAGKAAGEWMGCGESYQHTQNVSHTVLCNLVH